jgi:hypothetical protein
MRPWQFSKPKTPGFGISRTYYLSVLASKAVLPSIAEVINPRGEFSAIVGFGVPLGSNEKDSLRQPLTRGAYAVATKDRKTVLKLLVLNRDEAGFDPEVFARSALAQSAEPELVARIRGTWTIAQLTFESHDPMVYSALDFLLSVAQRLAMMSDGVVADAVSQRYLLPQEVFHPDRLDSRVDARDHVATHSRTRPDGIHTFTLGLQKFSMPEIEITGLFPGEESIAGRFLLTVAQASLQGNLVRPGDRLGSVRLPFEAREGGFDKALWEGIPVLELLPPTSASAGEALDAWLQEAVS